MRAEGRRRNGAESWLNAAATGVLLVVIGALAVRLVCAYETREVPTIWHLVGDAAGYYRWAQEIARGAWLGTKPFYQAPLYPYVLAGCFRALGDGVWTIRVVQAVWGAAACGLVYVGTRRLFGTGAGGIAGIMLTLYGPAIFFDGIVQKASLTCLLVCGLFAATAWYGEQGSWRAAGVLGAAAGLLAITRENAMVWLPVLGLWVWRGEGNRRLPIPSRLRAGVQREPVGRHHQRQDDLLAVRAVVARIPAFGQACPEPRRVVVLGQSLEKAAGQIAEE